MSYLQKKIDGREITLLIKSSNLLQSIYNYDTKELVVTFTNGSVYRYHDVTPEIYTEFQQAESQGKVFNKTIRKLKFTKEENNPKHEELLNEVINLDNKK